MLELRDKITTGRHRGQKTLENIQRYLAEKPEAEKGAYLCSYAVFENIYRVMERLAGRNSQSMLLMLCTLEEEDTITGEESAAREALVKHFENAICASLRKTDVVCRCGKLQYLVLLVNTTHASRSAIQKRIDARFGTHRPKLEIRYYVRNLNEMNGNS